jgi:hypothetical protein
MSGLGELLSTFRTAAAGRLGAAGELALLTASSLGELTAARA